MGLKQRIEEDLRAAIKSKATSVSGALRLVLAAIKNREIEERRALDDSAVTKVLTSLIKQRTEAAELYRKGKRNELAEKEETEMVLLKKYLPEQLSGNELEALVDAAISESDAAGPQDMGKVMKVLVSKVQGRADGRIVSDLVKRKLC